MSFNNCLVMKSSLEWLWRYDDVPSGCGKQQRTNTEKLLPYLASLTVWLVEQPGRRVLQSGDDIGCRLLRRERTSQPDMMELLDEGNCRPINWPCTPPAAEVLANVNDAERQQWIWSNFRLCNTSWAAALSAFCRGRMWTAVEPWIILVWYF